MGRSSPPRRRKPPPPPTGVECVACGRDKATWSGSYCNLSPDRQHRPTHARCPRCRESRGPGAAVTVGDETVRLCVSCTEWLAAELHMA